MKKDTILVVEDEIRSRKLFEINFGDKYNVITAGNGREAIDILNSTPVNLVITDLRMPVMDGMELLRYIKAEFPFVPVIVITAYGSIENAVEAMKQGAFDYIVKPLRLEHIEIQIRKALEIFHLKEENTSLKKKLSRQNEIIAQSPHTRRIIEKIKQVAPTNATILLEGETGVGKSVFARLIHNLSQRKDNKFVEINCGAIPKELMESELFGHEKGAFTGAVKTKVGKFELADKGTLFLDEIGELPLDMQVKLLHAIENKRITRVGGLDQINVDVRIIAATNKDLAAEVENGNFRKDLYYRLNVVKLTIPPLRDRKEDIEALTKYFIEKFSVDLGKNVRGIDPQAMELLKMYPWPGNIRELMNVIMQAIVFAPTDIITPGALPQEIKVNSDIPLTKEELQEVRRKIIQNSVADLDRRFLINLMMRTKGNVSQAARISGYDRRQIINLLQKYGINARDFKDME